MRWYHAYDECAELWKYGGETKEEAIEEGRGWYDPADSFSIAPEEQRTDEDFASAVTHALTWHFYYVDEALAEKGWIDPEDSFLEGNQEIEQMLREFVRERLIRPEWRCVNTSKAETIYPEEEDA